MALVNNPLFARYFARFGGRNEERGNRELRQEMLAGLSDRVLEVGPGNGLNFPHYPPSVQEVVAVEPAMAAPPPQAHTMTTAVRTLKRWRQVSQIRCHTVQLSSACHSRA
jgi:hypothetical protein